MFLSSYAPLFLILAIRFHGAILRGFCAVLAAIGFLYLIVALGVVARRTEARSYPVTAVKDAAGEVAGYLASYLLPFVTVSSPSAGDLVGYGILVLVILAIFLRSELVQINPTLYLFGWRIVAITVNGGERYLVCRRLPRPPAEIRAVRVAGLLVRKEPRHGR